MTEIDDHDPRHLTDQDIAALLDEAGRETSDQTSGLPESALDVKALEVLVLEEETNLAGLLPGFVAEGMADGASTTPDETVSFAVQPVDAPVLATLNILFGFDHGDGLG